MSLFIGNVSKKVTSQEFEDAFKSHGNCKIDLRKRYAFVQYDSERCAEQAKQALQNVNFSGLRLNIQWSKNSGRFNENSKGGGPRKERRRGRSDSRDRSWRKQQRHMRRSPSYERRHAPSYSDNEEVIDGFEPKCPRDRQLLRRLKIQQEKKRQRQQKKKQPKIEPQPQKEKEEQKPRQEQMELEAGEAV